jgi:hypothetical protein
MPLDISSRSESVSANRSDPKGSGHARDAHTFALEFSAHIGTIKLPFRKSLCYRGPRMAIGIPTYGQSFRIDCECEMSTPFGLRALQAGSGGRATAQRAKAYRIVR